MEPHRPSAARVASLYRSAGRTFTVFHGTRTTHLPKIKSEGLASPMGYNSASWYMVAEDFASAAHHSQGHGGDPVVVEFRVPTESKMQGGRERHMWDGYPSLWKPHSLDWEGSGSTRWWALRQVLPPEFIVRVHSVSD